MNRIAFVFIHGPHGKTTGREGCDALLAASGLTDDIGVFFIADGVLLLMSHQQPEQILARDFITAFGILSLYNIDKFYLCAESAMERGLNANVSLVLNAKWLSVDTWHQYLSFYDIIMTF